MQGERKSRSCCLSQVPADLVISGSSCPITILPSSPQSFRLGTGVTQFKLEGFGFSLAKLEEEMANREGTKHAKSPPAVHLQYPSLCLPRGP